MQNMIFIINAHNRWGTTSLGTAYKTKAAAESAAMTWLVTTLRENGHTEEEVLEAFWTRISPCGEIYFSVESMMLEG